MEEENKRQSDDNLLPVQLRKMEEENCKKQEFMFPLAKKGEETFHPSPVPQKGKWKMVLFRLHKDLSFEIVMW